MVPSRPSPRKDQVVDQAKKFQNRASSCPALWNRYTMPAASASSTAAASALSARVTACAWGLVVWERGAAGLYEVLVAPHRRRQGLGRVLLGAMLQWAQQQGATHTDLQVLGSNQPARQLYASLGFAPVYGYHYRAQPQPA